MRKCTLAIHLHRRRLLTAAVWVAAAAGVTACGNPAFYTRGPDPSSPGPGEGTGGAIVDGTGGVTAVDGSGMVATGGGLGGAGGGAPGRSDAGADGAAAGGQAGSEGAAGVGGLGVAGTGGGAWGVGGTLGMAGAGGARETATPDGHGGAGGITGGGSSGGGGGGSRGITGAGGRLPFSDPTKVSFESSSEGWYAAAGSFSNVGRRTRRAYAGVASLGATLQYAGGTSVTNTLAADGVAPATAPGPGAVVTLHVYLPADARAIEWIQPFVQDTNLTYASAFTERSALTFGAWNTIKVTIPPNALPTLHVLGVELRTSGSTPLFEDVFIDAIDW